MQEERGLVPWWNWEPNEFGRVARLRLWVRQQAEDGELEEETGLSPPSEGDDRVVSEDDVKSNEEK
jgi:hypothetical protein